MALLKEGKKMQGNLVELRPTHYEWIVERANEQDLTPSEFLGILLCGIMEEENEEPEEQEEVEEGEEEDYEENE